MPDLDQLFRQHGAMVYRRALRLLGNPADAEEATQEVFVKVMQSDHVAEGLDSVTAWLYRVTTNYCLNVLRDRARRRELLSEHGADLGERGARPADAGDVAALRALLAKADEAQAQAAIYVYLDGMGYREVGPLLGVSMRTVGNLLDRFRAWAEEQVAIPGGPTDSGPEGARA